MLERLSLEKAMRLRHEQPITVIARRSRDIREIVLVSYAGYSMAGRCHLFLIRTQSGVLREVTDIEIGLRGDVATARFAEPERPATFEFEEDLVEASA